MLKLVPVLREYSLPIIATLMLHGVLALWLAADFTDVDKHVQIKPKSIKASLVSLQETLKKPPRPVKKPEKKPNKPPVKPKPEPKKPIKDKKAEQAAKKALALKKKKEAERIKKEQLEKQRLEAERLEKERLESERQEKLRQEQLNQQALENSLLDDLAEEERLEQEFAQQSADEATATTYMAAIKASIESNWSRPPSARNGMKVTLQIELVPTGAVVGVNIIESSGNDVFDSSAVAAVQKTERFDELAELESRVFEKYYRRFRLIFNPEDLRL